MANKFLGTLGLDVLVNKIKDVIAKLDTKQDNIGAKYYVANNEPFCLAEKLGIDLSNGNTASMIPSIIRIDNAAVDGNKFTYADGNFIVLIWDGGVYSFIDGVRCINVMA